MTHGRELSTGIERGGVRAAHIATYHNAYGTHFVCSSTCYFVLLVYIAVLAVSLVILFLVPVALSSSRNATKHSGSAADSSLLSHDLNKISQSGNDTLKQYRGRDTVPQQAHSWWPQWLSALWSPWHQTDSIVVTIRDDEATKRLLEREQQLHAREQAHLAQPVKTYESIAVDTTDMEPVSDPPPPASTSSPGRRGSIFAPAPSPIKKKPVHARHLGRSATGGNLLSSAASTGTTETSFFSEHTDAPRGLSELLGGDGKNERLVRAIERRASIQHRAEKRKEQAKSDISYENLRDDEIQMYEYLEFVRELLEGMVVKKLCQHSTKVVKRTFFITKDMSTVYWNQLGAKNWIQKKSSLDASRIDKVLRGFHGNANVETKGKAEKSALYVSVVCTDGKQLDLEAKDEAMRQRLFLGFSRLATEKRAQQSQSPAQGGGDGGAATTDAAATLSRAVSSRFVTRTDGNDQDGDDNVDEEEKAEVVLSPPLGRSSADAGASYVLPTAAAATAVRDPETHDGLEFGDPETETIGCQQQLREQAIEEEKDSDDSGDSSTKDIA